MAMIVVRSPEEWAARFPSAEPAGAARTVVTVGNFDGVHRGHQKILRGVVEPARETQLRSVVVTFDPHPLRVLRPADAPPMLATLEERLAIFEELGLDAALVLRFDLALASLSPEEFVRRILLDCLRARVVRVGTNFRFGHRQTGDVKVLAGLGREFGFEVDCVTPLIMRGVVLSSTAIRRAVGDGHLDRACRWLGRPFCVRGTIRAGSGTGRRLVVPTLNLETTQELLPKAGVYATESVVAVECYRSATNVGFRPTFDGRRLTVESHLFDFSRDLTSGPMEVRFWMRLRDERKFAGPEALRAQVLRDLDRAQNFFRRLDRSRKAEVRSRKLGV